MKTLDEVIDAMEYEAQYNNGEQRDFDADALHYLKEYQGMQTLCEANQQKIDDAVRQRDAHIKALAELKRNEPITWDELRQMEGKPVWVEWATPRKHYREWFLLDVQGEGTIVFRAVNGDSLYLSECDLGKTWQAYRKERS